jgi:hypothetical protein
MLVGSGPACGPVSDIAGLLLVNDVVSERAGALYADFLISGEGKAGACDLGRDRQFAAPSINEYGQGDAGGSAVVEYLVQGGTNGAAGMKYVVYEQDILSFDLEGYLGRLDLGMQPDTAEIITIEADVQGAYRGGYAKPLLQGFSYPDTTGMDANDAGFMDVALLHPFTAFLFHRIQ